MLTPRFTGSFKKDKKLAQKRGKEMSKLREVTTMIINEQPLPPERKNHPLHGNHKGKWECHVEPDWVLVYKIEPENHKVVFHRTGSHSDLF